MENNIIRNGMPLYTHNAQEVDKKNVKSFVMTRKSDGYTHRGGTHRMYGRVPMGDISCLTLAKILKIRIITHARVVINKCILRVTRVCVCVYGGVWLELYIL